MFDIKQWLASADTSGADKSLDDDAARLLVLNHALVNVDSGPVLASLIVCSDGSHGLDAFPHLARGSEPRFVGMALLNMLYTLRGERSGNCEFTYNPSVDDPAQELILRATDLPSEEYVLRRIATVMQPVSVVFMEKASEGDLCPDFLTYILTILMDLSQAARKDNDLRSQLSRVPSQPFLKAIMRVWKSVECSEHVSTSEANDGLNLGFLVTCYLRSVCASAKSSRGPPAAPSAAGSHGSHGSEDEETETCGLKGFVAMSDWFIKFVSMRLYHESLSAGESEHLISVLTACAEEEPEFAVQLVRLHFSSTVKHCATRADASLEETEAPLTDAQCVERLSSLLPYLNVVSLLTEMLDSPEAPDDATSEVSRARRNWIARVWDTLGILSKQAFAVLVNNEFNSDGHGTMQKKFAVSFALQLIALAWRTNDMHRRIASTRRSGVTTIASASFKRWFNSVTGCIDRYCRDRLVQWTSLSEAPELAAVRASLNTCLALMRQENAQRRDSELRPPRPHTASNTCEWCLEGVEAPKLCSVCKKVAYCSAGHQRAHWRAGHKTECSFLRNAMQGCSFVVEDDGMILGLRLVTDGQQAEDGDGMPFWGVHAPQRNEMQLLAFRLPGVFSEMWCTQAGLRITYHTRGHYGEACAGGTEGVSQAVDLCSIRACLSACNRQCRVHLNARGRAAAWSGRGERVARIVRLYFHAFGKAQSLRSVVS